MKIFPAIDLIGGRVVRLTQGDYDNVSVYSDSPSETAKVFYNDGSDSLHIVDLDGAKRGELCNLDTISAIIKAAPLFTQVGGGIRDEERIKRYLDIGVSRVILGTVALRDPDFTASMAAKYGERIAVGVDARDSRVAVEGWLDVSDTDSVSFVRSLADMGVKTVIYTDISRDGAMQGSNIDIYNTLCKIGGTDIIASGGVSSVSEIPLLKDCGVKGAIIGKALYTGHIVLKDALSAARGV